MRDRFLCLFAALWLTTSATIAADNPQGDAWIAQWRGSHPTWRGIHLLTYDDKAVDALVPTLPRLAKLGINTLILEVDYHFEFQSHPELRDSAIITRAGAARMVKAAHENGIRVIPQFSALGHQSWSKTTFPLLTQHPEFDETPGKFPGNTNIYCRSWCPQHPGVNPMVFALLDDLIEGFQADAVHTGMDEVFLIASEHCPRCKGGDPAKLFARAVNDLHGHLVGERHVEMLLWADRLINAKALGYSEWEASKNGTDPAVDLIPKDVILCDWHYEKQSAGYPSVPFLMKKGFRVWPCGWKSAANTEALLEYSQKNSGPNLLGHLCSTWGSPKLNELADWPPIIAAMQKLK